VNESTVKGSSAALSLDKEGYTGVTGRLCRYAGDAERGLHIEFAPGDVLNVTAAQIKQIFADLSEFNLLLQDPRGLRDSGNFMGTIKAVARARRDHRANRANPQARGDPFSRVVSTRFAAWLNAHDVAFWNRSIGNQQAAYLQAAFCGEGLLPLATDRPGDFPIADILTSLRALVGQRVIYEEVRTFALVELTSVTSCSSDPDQVYLTLSNLNGAGFSSDYPPKFSAGGSLQSTSMSCGAIGGYMGIWKLITSPNAVATICERAPGLDRNQLLKLCRKVEYGERPSSVY
jgi:hypothetical protein